MNHAKIGAMAVAALVSGTLVGCSSEASSGGDYPSKSIELIIPNTPGGPNDVSARVVGECLNGELDQTVVPKNVEGASQAIGTRELMTSEPDGYTIAISPHTGLTLTPLLDDVGFSEEDITPIASVFETAMILVTSADSEYQSGEALFDAAEDNPGDIKVGTPGPTSPKQVVLDALRSKYDVDLEAVPLDGQAGQVAAMLGNNVDAVAVEATNDVREQIDAGKFIPLAAIGDEPVNWLPDVPTLSDLGFEDAALPNNVYLAFGPKGMPEDVVDTLEGAIKDCMASEDVIAGMGELYVPDPFLGAADTADMLSNAAETYESVVETE
ncbi:MULTISPECIES: tripartite tricarboxylate transporter substrate binding protein [unclassified Nocardioides]|uniref:tripartite tricarboxylate transporter substrate binding protein n=1 Tax=unclassified Nocardioides TaxID=2615069 RepID=UPI00361ED3F3